jgi:hypothetical protein
MMPVSIERQISCVKRELAIREKIFPQWVDSGRLTPESMKRELDGMRAVLATLEGLRRPWDGIERRQPQLDLSEAALSSVDEDHPALSQPDGPAA